MIDLRSPGVSPVGRISTLLSDFWSSDGVTYRGWTVQMQFEKSQVGKAGPPNIKIRIKKIELCF